jgi:hypothetical protein
MEYDKLKFGKVLTDITKEILHENAKWIKMIDSCGKIYNYDWSEKYEFLRTVTNYTYPGYLIHEAVVWHPCMNSY